MAREFSRDLRLLVLDQPTRGLDVGSIEFIHRQVIAKRDAGTAVLLSSAELDEVLELSDRIAVMYRGRIVALVDGPTADKEAIGLLMATGGRTRGRRRPMRAPHERPDAGLVHASRSPSGDHPGSSSAASSCSSELPVRDRLVRSSLSIRRLCSADRGRLR